jgi:exopolysaccharide biosynthesis protein
MSLPTLAQILLELGSIEALNLDGGGSTTMVVRNKVVNRPSDQTGERPVSDAILIFPKRN